MMTKQLEYAGEFLDYRKYPPLIGQCGLTQCGCQLVLPRNHDKIIREVPLEYFDDFEDIARSTFRKTSGMDSKMMELDFIKNYGLIAVYTGNNANGINRSYDTGWGDSEYQPYFQLQNINNIDIAKGLCAIVVEYFNKIDEFFKDNEKK